MALNEAGQEPRRAAGTGGSPAGRNALGIHEYLLILGQSRKVPSESQRLVVKPGALVPGQGKVSGSSRAPRSDFRDLTPMLLA